MIIDCHCHVFPPQVKKNRRRYIESDPCFALLYSNSKAKLATTEELINSMDKAGIDVSVIANIGWTTHELCVETNDYILESITRYPDRLIGFCSVQPLSCDAALCEIERCAKAGIRGVGELRPDIQMFDLMDEQVARPLVGMMVKHKLTFLSHSSEPVGHQYPGKGIVTPEMLYPFIKSYPELKIICAHWGGGLPFYSLMPEVKKSFKNVFFDSAASPLLYEPEIYRHLTQIAGADKILFGSDYPLIEQKRALQEVTSLGLPKEAEVLITGGNASQLFGLKD
jgi:predicted TIM-barrel fold metal-dependent hydrolase